MAIQAGSIQVKIDLRKLEKLANGLGPKAEDVLQTSAEKIRKTAYNRAPVRTGNLRSSITVRKPKPFEREIGDQTEYGIFQEFGTVHMQSHPFMIPALEAERADFLRAWSEVLK